MAGIEGQGVGVRPRQLRGVGWTSVTASGAVKGAAPSCPTPLSPNMQREAEGVISMGHCPQIMGPSCLLKEETKRLAAPCALSPR